MEFRRAREVDLANFKDLAPVEPRDPLIRLGLVELVHEVAGFRRYRLTENGAAEIGLSKEGSVGGRFRT